jgi:hypothetical protein
MTNIPNEDRLCSHDGACGFGDSGCRRSDTILAFEAEFDTFVDASLEWGMHDMFFRHENHVYYYKPQLQDRIDNDIEISKNENAPIQTYRKIVDYLNYEVPSLLPANITDLNWIRNEVFAKNPPGLPKFVLETPNFFKLEIECENPSNTKHIGIDDLDRPTLDKIKKDIGGEYNPFLDSYFESSIYNYDGRYYCMNPFSYKYNPDPKGQIGIFLAPDKESSKYENATINSYFFTFQRITPEQREFILDLGKLHTSPLEHPNDTIVKEYFKL